MERKDDILDEVTSGEYKYGFVTDIDTETFPKGLSEEVVPADLADQGRARVDDRLSSEGLPSLADAYHAALAASGSSGDRLSGHQLLCRSEKEASAGEHGRGRSGAEGDVRPSSACRSRSRCCFQAWPSMRSWTPFR